MLRLSLIAVVLSALSTLSAEISAVQYLAKPIMSSDKDADAAMDALYAMRAQADLAWADKEPDAFVLNGKRVYDLKNIEAAFAGTLVRREIKLSEPVQWVMHVQGAHIYRCYVNGTLVGSSAYNTRMNHYYDLNLESGTHLIEVVSVVPADKKYWVTGLRCGEVFTKEIYNDAQSTWIELQVSSAYKDDALSLQSRHGILTQLSKDADNANGFHAAIPFVAVEDAYDDAQVVIKDKKRIAIDLSASKRWRDFEAKTEADIRTYRTASLTVQAEPGAAVQVRLRRHAFPFGTAINASMFHDEESYAVFVEQQSKKSKPSKYASIGWDTYKEIQQQYQDILTRYFNAAVHENALKWYAVERTEGRTKLAAADRALKFCEENDIHVRGHCLFWDVPKYTKGWRKEFFETAPKAEVEAAVQARAISLPWYYRGRIDEWDLNNEMVHGRLYRDLLGDDIVLKMAQWARIGNPNAVLYLNDFAILNAHDGNKYIEQIQGFLDQGVPIGGIGCQSHFFGRGVDVFHMRAVLDKLAQFNLPIKSTEFDVGGSPEQQAREFIAFYRTLFAHPAVDGILMWGFWAGKHWRGDDAPWAKDFTAKPAAQAYIKLITQDWHTEWSGKAGADGQVEIPAAFYGLYQVTINGEQSEVWHRKMEDKE